MIDKKEGRLICIARLRVLADSLEANESELKTFRLTAHPLSKYEELLLEVQHIKEIPAMDVPKEKK